MSIVPQLTISNIKTVSYFRYEGELTAGTIVVTNQHQGTSREIKAIVNNGAKFGATKMSTVDGQKIINIMRIQESFASINTYLSTGGIKVILKNQSVYPNLIRDAKVFNSVAKLKAKDEKGFSEEFWFMFLGFLIALGNVRDNGQKLGRRDIQDLVLQSAKFHQGSCDDNLYKAWTHLGEKLNEKPVFAARNPDKKGKKVVNTNPKRGNGKKKVDKTPLTEVEPDLVDGAMPGKPDEPPPLGTSDGKEETTA